MRNPSLAAKLKLPPAMLEKRSEPTKFEAWMKEKGKWALPGIGLFAVNGISAICIEESLRQKGFGYGVAGMIGGGFGVHYLSKWLTPDIADSNLLGWGTGSFFWLLKELIVWRDKKEEPTHYPGKEGVKTFEEQEREAAPKEPGEVQAATTETFMSKEKFVTNMFQAYRDEDTGEDVIWHISFDYYTGLAPETGEVVAYSVPYPIVKDPLTVENLADILAGNRVPIRILVKDYGYAYELLYRIAKSLVDRGTIPGYSYFNENLYTLITVTQASLLFQDAEILNAYNDFYAGLEA